MSSDLAILLRRQAQVSPSLERLAEAQSATLKSLELIQRVLVAPKKEKRRDETKKEFVIGLNALITILQREGKLDRALNHLREACSLLNHLHEALPTFSPHC